ncbi:heavy metal translocating P-type ATPase [Cellvibrio japonicus]|uniref:Cation-transporting P-type ATPase n=1 Tax=Cellvibrio japonicus (strain Ueda107) TaxID=498211 RepID=B3PLK8_CELJU|nr:heavy metal translocating P-type ATPase [Cellvibrio japonicus]ACE84207.1 cation-transporting P-type ATPase [Cellvibrio japonicus Ueda107]QEI12996.1 cadmium-translocating P-type ATPase [Cellvibrio japonicus]QEI16570.1 cadmium-translocating P-type ATPase [Cellvibrio japonicus]QEI20148.1 cadmium-translocating P-type ATPase [Cellvibrio japonicus]
MENARDTSAECACYHCGLPVPPASYYPVRIQGDLKRMCCPGCQAVATAIVEGGLESFYQFRSQSSERPDSGERGLASWKIYDLPEVQSEFVVPLDANLRQANLLLEGITCAACSWLIETHLKKFPGVRSVTVNVSTHRCTLIWDADTPLSTLFAALVDIGYTPRPATDEQQQQLIKKENRISLMRIGVAGFGMMQAMMVAVGMYTGATDFWLDFLRWLSMLVATPVVFFSAWPFFQAAWRSIRMRQLVMDVPVALAIGLAYLASVWATITSTGEVYFESVSMFTFFLLLGRYVELRARHRNRLAFGNLAQLMPLTACCIREENGCEIEQNLPLKTLNAGDMILVKPGETFPCDGRVLAGESAVVEALLTGESQPVSKKPGDMVIAGTLNHHSPLKVEVIALGAATQLSAIERMASQAADEKPQQVLIGDRIARFFIARLLVVCTVVFAFWLWYRPGDAFWITLSVLVVTCPCALALAMPAALSAATANLRQRGFLVARGHVIETLTQVNRVIFDKTGTLTRGKFAVERVISLADGEPQHGRLLALAAALEAGSNHPLAMAFHAWRDQCQAEQVKQLTAAGVEGVIDGLRYRLGTPAFAAELGSLVVPDMPDGYHTWLLLGSETQLLAWIGLVDEARAEAKPLIERLKARGIAVELLSGDQSGAVAQLAAHLGIETFRAGATPGDKLSRLGQCQAAGDKVLMVGDGINDVPVLAGADVSVAMACSSDLAQTRADAVLLNDHLLVLADAIALAHRTQRVIKQNLRFSLVYNLLALPLAAAGFVPPWLAAMGMTASSLVVIFNALRLKH